MAVNSFKFIFIPANPRKKIIFLNVQLSLKGRILGHLGGPAVEHLPWAQVVIPESWDQIPFQVPHREPASPSVSLPLCLP